MKNKTALILAAGGVGARMGADMPKQFIKILGKEIIMHTIDSLLPCDFIDKLVIVCHSDYADYCRELVSGINKDITVISGADTRQESVYKGLMEIADCKYVLVHDAVRCLVNKDDVYKLHDELISHGSCTLAVRVTDTVKIADNDNFVIDTPDRDSLWQIQTPQAFITNELISAHDYAKETGYIGTDDCSLIEHFGKRVKLVEGNYENIKITTRFDLQIAKAILKGRD